jgi:dTDP-4-amino-4,6-dideoxygalactose transaminase
VAAALTAPAPGDVCAWHVFPLVLNDDVDRATFRDHLHREGVQTSIHYPPLHLTPAFSPFAREPLPATESYARRTVTVPLFPHMTDAQVEIVVSAITTACATHGGRTRPS